MTICRIAIVLTTLCLCGSRLLAHEWSDVSGRFKFDAEFFAASDDTVVIKKQNGLLVGVKIDELSPADRTFIDEKKKELAATATSSGSELDTFHTWTSRKGFELRGRVVGFGKRDIVIQREFGMANVNGTVMNRLNGFYQQLLPVIVAQYADRSVKTAADVERWLATKGKEPQTFTVEGVKMKFEDGSEIPVPFFIFSEKDLAILQPGWEQWKSEQASEEDRKREDFLMSAQAESYQKQQQAQAQSHQIQMMQLGLMAVNAGLTSIWEVLLQSGQGNYSRRTSVVVPARDSLQAEQMALQRYPGYQLAGVRRLNN